MFFYEIGAVGYDDHYSHIFVSENEYSQEDFEDIIFKVYERVCYSILEDDESSPCFMNIFFDVEDTVFSSVFDRILERDFGLCRVNYDRLQGRVGFSLHGYDKGNVFNRRLDSIRDGLDFDMSCYDEGCFRLDDDTRRDVDEVNHLKSKCLVNLIKEKL